MADCMLQDIRENMEKLIAAYETQRSRADSLEAELEKYRKQSETAKVKITELEDKIDNLGLRNVFSSESVDNSQAKARIDQLIAKIDSCLEMLQ